MDQNCTCTHRHPCESNLELKYSVECRIKRFHDVNRRTWHSKFELGADIMGNA